MRLITRCPQCETAFTLDAERLRQAQGWARCGNCFLAFEAQLHLYEQASASASPRIVSDVTDQPEAEFAEIPQILLTPAPEPKRPRSTLALVLGALLSLLLLSALLLQLALHKRDILGAMEPRLAPVLEELCACKLQWPMDAKAVLIEGSSFQLQPEGSFALELNLKNTLSYPLASPALELHLTNAEDQTVIRKILHPADVGLPDVLSVDREHLARAVFLVEAPHAAQVVGFRVELFYP